MPTASTAAVAAPSRPDTTPAAAWAAAPANLTEVDALGGGGGKQVEGFVGGGLTHLGEGRGCRDAARTPHHCAQQPSPGPLSPDGPARAAPRPRPLNPPNPAKPGQAPRPGAVGGAGRRAAPRALLPPPEPGARRVRGERASGGGRAGGRGASRRGERRGRNFGAQMPEGAAALPGCRCCPCGPRARLRRRRCPRRGVCTELVKVCVAGAAGAAAAAAAPAGPNACHFPGRWQRQPAAPEPSPGLLVRPRDLIG